MTDFSALFLRFCVSSFTHIYLFFQYLLFIIYSYSSEDEYEPAGVVPGRQQAQWPAGLSPAWQLAQVQLQHSDPGPAQQPHPRLWYTAVIEH